MPNLDEIRKEQERDLRIRAGALRKHTPQKIYNINTDEFEDNWYPAFVEYQVETGYQGSYDEYKAWRAKTDDAA